MTASVSPALRCSFPGSGEELEMDLLKEALEPRCPWVTVQITPAVSVRAVSLEVSSAPGRWMRAAAGSPSCPGSSRDSRDHDWPSRAAPAARRLLTWEDYAAGSGSRIHECPGRLAGSRVISLFGTLTRWPAVSPWPFPGP